MHTPFVRKFVCALCALSILTGALLPAAFAAGAQDTSAQDTLTAAEARQMQQADEAVTALTDSEEYESMPVDERGDAAVAQLQQLAGQGLVRARSIYVDEQHNMVSFTYACGALGGILLEEPDESETETFAVPLGAQASAAQVAAALEAGQADTEEENGLLESLGSRYEFLGNAIIYYAFDDLINSTRYPYYAYMQAYWTTLGFTTQLDTSVTVSDLRHMDKYDLCILSAHGSYYTYASNYFASELKTEPVILLLEESTTLKDMLYGLDLLSHRVIKVNGYYCITPEFFRASYRGNQLNGTVILSETCEFLGVSGSEDSSMAEAMLAGGADAVVGFVNNVYAVYSRSVMWDIVNHLIIGDTLRESLDHARTVYGADDVEWYNTRGGKRPHALASYAVIYGNETASLYSDAAAAAIAAGAGDEPAPDAA